ncbi:MAG: rhomboid family intramembrane serine protease [Meiothermus sp.]|uniref:rhomboid family intramembrane serine protease n=1 Tax=Meiothermus sp. TaxID=1955249 RepID=UPI0025F0296F|nr:rhomboid family intramembrane serine protease [Meiothermus sp.]MCS7058629.1 rhomboid family intramembrane serine protease [Meiothermus sp.]MCS7193889.1 rhomboid family intramembrane serine protease [Meiothermus sp.]MDW8090165.1 rhomboid family intramembrane serine protease [Meiothermus sp.]
MFPLHDINRAHRRPYVLYLLVILNLWGFFYTYFLTDPAYVIQAYGFVPARFLADPLGEWPTLFTSMFLHGGLLHLLGNLWFLWVFGDNVEDRLGHGRFLLFYLLGGVAAAFAQGLISGLADVPMIGASGAISALLGAYVVLYPRALILSLIGWIPVPVPAVIYLGYWLLLQFLGDFMGQEGIAFWAHIGGFVVGALLIRTFDPLRHH